MLGVAWPSIRDALNAPLAGLGVLLGAMTVTQFGASTFSGAIRERLGTTRVLLFPAAMAAAGLALFAIATDWIVITLASAILGAGVGLLDAAINTEAALRRGVRFMAALHGAWAVGAAIGPPLITVAIGLGSWRFGYGVGAVAFVLVAAATLTLRNAFEQAPMHDLAAAPSARTHLFTGAALMFVYVGIELGAGQWAFTRFIAADALETNNAAVAPANVAALVALPLLGVSLSVFVPVLIYVTPQRVGHEAAPHAIGYMVAAGMLGGAALPALTGLVMQNGGVTLLGPALVLLAVALAVLHRASLRA